MKLFCSLFLIQFWIVTDDDMSENDQQDDNPIQNGKMKINMLLIVTYS